MATFNNEVWERLYETPAGEIPMSVECYDGDLTEEQEGVIDGFEDATEAYMDAYRQLAKAFGREPQF